MRNSWLLLSYPYCLCILRFLLHFYLSIISFLFLSLYHINSAHGVPESYIKAGDPYKRHIEECVALISEEVSAQLSSDRTRPSSISKSLGLQLAGAISGKSAPTKFHLSFQSRVGPVQWLKYVSFLPFFLFLSHLLYLLYCLPLFCSSLLSFPLLSYLLFFYFSLSFLLLSHAIKLTLAV